MQWVCVICGYMHDDDDRPGNCPVCGAHSNKFTEYFEGEDKSEEKDKTGGMDDFEKDLYANYEDENI